MTPFLMQFRDPAEFSDMGLRGWPEIGGRFVLLYSHHDVLPDVAVYLTPDGIDLYRQNPDGSGEHFQRREPFAHPKRALFVFNLYLEWSLQTSMERTEDRSIIDDWKGFDNLGTD